MSKNTELISSTAHASHLAYGFESVRKPGFNNYRIVDEAQIFYSFKYGLFRRYV